MAKYSYEFKLKAVQAYLNGEGSYEYLAKKYNISACSKLKEWVASYKEFGKEGIMRSRKNNKYSFQFKLSVVELYLSSEVSYQELALSQGINNQSLITRWVNDFRIAGPDALRPKKKGRKKTLDTRELTKSSQSNEEEPAGRKLLSKTRRWQAKEIQCIRQDERRMRGSTCQDDSREESGDRGRKSKNENRINTQRADQDGQPSKNAE